VNDLELAHLLADAADAITLPAYTRTGLSVSTKSDGSVVTEADLATETEIRRLLTEYAPLDGVIGEEHGVSGGDTRRWYVDPIDGTSSFVAGRPEWATMVALEEGPRLLAAAISSPALGRRWYAASGDGAWASGDGGRMRVSRVAVPELARVSAWPPPFRQKPRWSTVVEGFVRQVELAGAAVKGLRHKPTRDTGFPNAGVLLAAGGLEGFLLCGGGPWDLAPLVLLVEEAGGMFSDLDGGRRLDTGAGLFSNALLHDTLLGWVVSN
jgi:histidinol-phosphatase